MHFYMYAHWYMIGILLVCIGVAVLNVYWVKKRQRLAKGLLRLGDLFGKRYNEFTATLGAPKNVDKRVDPDTQEPVRVVTWQSGSHQIIIMFDKDDIFNRVISESRYDK